MGRHDTTRPPLRIALVAGTRPEAIKLAPLLLAARGQSDVVLHLIHTGQHRAPFAAALEAFGVGIDGSLDLALAGLPPDDQADRIRIGLPPVLAALDPDMVLVQGDTTSAWAAAHSAHGMAIPVGHVEAGLRSGDPNLPWPEERNRREIDAIADLLFAPSERAAANLRDEGVPGRITVTGNTGIDALLRVAARMPARMADDGATHILATCHRRENWGDALDRIADALRRLVANRYDRRVTLLLHPNPDIGERLRAALAGVPRITLAGAAAFPDMVAALKGADLVLSDSGGLQEECAALGIPLLVLRANTERPEVIASGNARLVGTGVREIVDAAERILGDPACRTAMSVPAFPYGRGDAADRILTALATFPFARR